MSTISLPGQTKISTLQDRFKAEFGLTLRVYDGRSFAEADATIGQVRKKRGATSVDIRRNTKVGNLEVRFIEDFGIKVQIAGSDDSYLCDNALRVVRSHELEEVTGLDRFALARQFRALFATSPHRFLIMRRLDHARRLITRGESLAGPRLGAGASLGLRPAVGLRRDQGDRARRRGFKVPGRHEPHHQTAAALGRCPL